MLKPPRTFSPSRHDKLVGMIKSDSAPENGHHAEIVQRVPKLAYTPAEAAEAIGVCQDTIYRLLKRGLLRSSTALRHKLIPHSELERFLKSTLN